MGTEVLASSVGTSWEFPLSRDEKTKRCILLAEMELHSLRRDLAEARWKDGDTRDESRDVDTTVESVESVESENEAEGTQQAPRQRSVCINKKISGSSLQCLYSNKLRTKSKLEQA